MARNIGCAAPLPAPWSHRAARRRRRLAHWTSQLPTLIESLCREWDLRCDAPLAVRPHSQLVAVQDGKGRALVLKLAPPGQAIAAEIAALRAFAGRGTVDLIRADAGRGALLLTRAHPGTPLTTLVDSDDDRATAIAAGFIAVLPCSPPAEGVFAQAAGWGRALAVPGLPAAVVDRAQHLLAALTAEASPLALLHGDLHHGNILADTSGAITQWIAIDPKGLIGDAAAECAALLRNPPCSLSLIRAPRRAAILAEISGLDYRRIVAWGYVGAVIAAGWAIEDGGHPIPILRWRKGSCRTFLEQKAAVGGNPSY